MAPLCIVVEAHVEVQPKIVIREKRWQNTAGLSICPGSRQVRSLKAARPWHSREETSQCLHVRLLAEVGQLEERQRHVIHFPNRKGALVCIPLLQHVDFIVLHNIIKLSL